ncbi:MAG: sigma-70 family RNA polymerase sigma factor [Phycisphaerae bacterium]|nr:sigma-70 family RNA polymerase sigma factor [Phycisphaerae bacterium]
MLEDKRLIWQLQSGSSRALCRIYEKYKDDLLRLAAALLNDVSGAEDVVHDVFSVFIKSASEFQLRGSLKGYLVTCVANRARNFNRDDYRHWAVDLDEAEQVVSSAEPPDRWLICSEEFSNVTNALAQLPPDQREVIVMHLYGGLVFRKIADLQEVTTKTVQSRYRYGLDKLRSLLGGQKL